MIELENITLKKILPSSILDEQIVAISKAIDKSLQDISSVIPKILLLDRLEDLPEPIIDDLAWQLHADFYELANTLSKKCAVVKESKGWHRYKGTPWAIESAVSTIFQSAKVLEWFEYGGKPFFFKVTFIKEPLIDIKKVYDVISVIEETKNVRSWCEGIEFFTEVKGKSYFGGYTETFDSVEINILEFYPQNGGFETQHFSGYTEIFDKIGEM